MGTMIQDQNDVRNDDSRPGTHFDLTANPRNSIISIQKYRQNVSQVSQVSQFAVSQFFLFFEKRFN